MTNIKKQTWSLSFCGIILVIKNKHVRTMHGMSTFTEKSKNASWSLEYRVLREKKQKQQHGH